MRTVAIVLGHRPLEFYRAKQAKRYYAQLNMRVFYFRAHSMYWLKFLDRIGATDTLIVSSGPAVSAALSRHGIPHVRFLGSSVHEFLSSLN